MQHNNDLYFERRVTTLEMQFERIDIKLDNSVNKDDFQLEMAKIDHKIDESINKMVWKLGGLIIDFVSAYPFILQYFGHK